MAYQTGDIILHDHYNTFASRINNIWGVGSTSSGYGQATTLPSVSLGVTVSATQWAQLIDRITVIGQHQGTSVGPYNTIVTGDIMEAIAIINIDITALEFANTNASLLGTSSLESYAITTTWSANIYPRQLLTWSSFDAMRYFFNAGGLLIFSILRYGGSSTTKNQAWTDLCAATGSLVISSGAKPSTIVGTVYTGTNKSGGSGTINFINSSFGAIDLMYTSGWTRLFQQYATSIYSSNYIQLHGAPQITNTQLKIGYNLEDVEGGDAVDGTIEQRVVIRPPSTTYLTNVWGIPTVVGSVEGTPA